MGFEAIVSITAGLVGIAAVLVPLVWKIWKRATARKAVFDHLVHSIFDRKNRWCTVEYIAKEEKLSEDLVRNCLEQLRKKGLTERSKTDEVTCWTLTNTGVEKHLSSW